MQTVCDLLARNLDWPRGSGAKLTSKAWLRLLVAAWERTQDRRADFYPAIDGEGFDVVFTRTSRLSIPEMDSLIEFAETWAQAQGGA